MAKAVYEPGWDNWRWQLARSRDMPDGGGLMPVPGADSFPFQCTPYYASLIEDPGHPNDPIRRMIAPHPEEFFASVFRETDPFAEMESTSIPGVVHRFADRLLIKATLGCACHCRYCTRRHLLQESVFSMADAEMLRHYVSAHPEIREVIISGGDPLTLGNDTLESLLRLAAELPNVACIRIGTRAPVVLPMRIDNALCRMLRRHGTIWLNTHFNHPREITAAARQACIRLVDAGIPVSNQTVLLHGVNDRVDVLRELVTSLQAIRVRPYYVFMCDPVAGTEHFRVSRERAVELERVLRASTGGLAVPRFVADVPGAVAKVPVTELHGDVSDVSAFERRVYHALGRVPLGRVTTYGMLAQAIGCRSAQAVGQALKRNRFAPYVPCHRVICGDLHIGGFGGERSEPAMRRKRAHLASEGVLFTENRLSEPDRLFAFQSLP